MEKRNLFVSGKAVVAAVCGAFTACLLYTSDAADE